ncbi:MAG TPA: DUF2723 domain-containing protein, partial [Verrucomicrobiae bacterium]|nr:DUF2723 domain-containing protein [Verrucomicrobiae bacterium]
MPQSLGRRPYVVATALGAVALAAYAAMAARDVAFGDGPELTAAAIRNGVAHPPGYPLWILLGHAASLLPLGSLALRVNLTAALYHAVAVALVYASAFVLVRRRGAALIAALALGFGSPVFVSWSLQAEVFSLDDAFAAAILLLCLLWLGQGRRWRLIVPLGALFGLGLSNQQSLIALAPLPLWPAWCGRHALPRDRRLAAALVLAAALLIAGFCLPYVHTLLASRAMPWHFGAARTPRELLDLIGRRAYGGFELVARAPDQGGSALARAAALAAAGGWPVVLELAGLVALAAARRTRELVLGALVVLPALLFCAAANIRVDDELLRAVFQRFALLPLTALAPFSACAIAAAQDALPQRVRSGGVAALACATALACAIALPSYSLAGEHGPRTLFRDIGNALPPGAILLTAGDPVDQPPQYFQGVEGWRPDVTVVTYGLLNYAPYVDAMRARLNVPLQAAIDPSPQVRRDVLAYANRTRPFCVTGERPIHAPGPLYHAQVTGVVS